MQYDSPADEIQKLENEIYKLHQKLDEARRNSRPQKIKNYILQTVEGKVTLLDLFGDKGQLIAIHNMGQGCRYCTLWADGINGFVPHLEDRFALVLLSKDPPELQRRFANSRRWNFRMASHGGGEYIQEQDVLPGRDNSPGVVCYERKGDEIFKKNSSVFGPGDSFCGLWSLLSLAGYNEETWTPQYNYWAHPKKMDDGGKNLKIVD